MLRNVQFSLTDLQLYSCNVKWTTPLFFLGVVFNSASFVICFRSTLLTSEETKMKTWELRVWGLHTHRDSIGWPALMIWWQCRTFTWFSTCSSLMTWWSLYKGLHVLTEDRRAEEDICLQVCEAEWSTMRHTDTHTLALVLTEKSLSGNRSRSLRGSSFTSSPSSEMTLS